MQCTSRLLSKIKGLIMAKSKKSIKNQKYENYWKLTLEYSDIYGVQFNTTLRMIVDYIDSNNLLFSNITSIQYQELQEQIMNIYPKADMGSTRKSINQFFKLGFINNETKGYHRLTRKFLSTINQEEKKRIFSKIMYENAAFERSYSKVSSSNEINFFIKTLEKNKILTKDDILTLVYTDVSSFPKGYLTKKEIELTRLKIDKNKFSERKYNQHAYIIKMFSHLTDVFTDRSNNFYIDQSYIDEKERKVRDPYLQRLYKLDLIDESKTLFGKSLCYFEKLSYPVLIASHIKPYSKSDKNEEFDINNGLLLSRNIDSLFDLGYITFDENGNTIYSSELDVDLVSYLSNYHLDMVVLNQKRIEYLEYHREKIFRQ